MYSRIGVEGYPKLLVAEVTQLLRDGGTVAINSVHELREPVSVLCEDLERELEVPVSADLYASFPSGARRPLAWNDHETILLQVSGAQSWSLYSPTVAYPTAHSTCQEPAGATVWEGELRTGGLLYVPRGWWFCDSPSREPTLYLAVRFRNLTGWDIACGLVRQLSALEIMRTDIPRFDTPEKQAPFLTALQRQSTKAYETPGLVLGFCGDAQALAEPKTIFGLPWTAQAGTLPSDEYEVLPLVRFPRRSALLFAERARTVGLLLWSGVVAEFPLDVADILGCILDNPQGVSIRRLIQECEGGISRARLIQVLSELMARGIIAIREPD